MKAVETRHRPIVPVVAGVCFGIRTKKGIESSKGTGMAKTLAEKVLRDHIVRKGEGEGDAVGVVAVPDCDPTGVVGQDTGLDTASAAVGAIAADVPGNVDPIHRA